MKYALPGEDPIYRIPIVYLSCSIYLQQRYLNATNLGYTRDPTVGFRGIRAFYLLLYRAYCSDCVLVYMPVGPS